MAKLEQSYESVIIVSTKVGEEGTKALVEKFTKLISDNGEVESVNEWGVRKLAYPIQDLTEGYYVLVKFTAPHEFPAELSRLYNINDSILRSLVVKCEQ